MEPVFVDSPEFYGEVYYGGVTRKEDNELVQYEFYADAKQEPLLIYTKLDNQRKLEFLQLWRVIRCFIEVGKKRIQRKPKQNN